MKRRRLVVGLGALGVAVLLGLFFWPRPTVLNSAPGASEGAGDPPRVPSPGSIPIGVRSPPSSAATGDAGGATGAATEPELIASFSWGASEDALGRSRQPEGNPEAPMSVTVGPDGVVWVVDQVNGRLVKVDARGRRLGSVPVPVQAAQDVVVTKDGTALVLDRLVDKAVAVIGPDGRPRGELPLEGKGLSEGGASTGLFADGDDVVVEREHGDSVRIGTTSGVRDTERGEVPGRPSRDGAAYFTATLVAPAQGLVALTAIAKATLEHRYTRQLSIGAGVLSIVLLDSDPTGVVALGVQVERPDSTPELPALHIVVLCVDGRDGQVLGRVDFPANQGADETFRELAMGPDGSIVFLRRTERGAQLERHRCR